MIYINVDADADVDIDTEADADVDTETHADIDTEADVDIDTEAGANKIVYCSVHTYECVLLECHACARGMTLK